jgi:predicted outer membrane repeat protein
MSAFARYLLVILAFAPCAVPRSVGAANNTIWVGIGTPESCTAAALQDALAASALNGGHTLKFNCGTGSVTIVLTSTLTLPNNTTINGDGAITLSGPVVGYLLVVNPGSTAVLKNLTITNLAGIPGAFDPRGWGVRNEGTLTVANSAFTGHDGGAIVTVGTLTVRDSRFSDNGFFHDSSCLAIDNDGVLAVSNSIFTRNRGNLGAVCNGGTATIKDSAFTDNFADQVGGAIFVEAGTTTMLNTTFSRNLAVFGGGSIFVFQGALDVNQSTFSENGSATHGGAIIGNGLIRNSAFSGNRAAQIGGALFGQFVVRDSEFSNNAAAEGGALFGGGEVAKSRFTGNSAVSVGGAISVRSPLTIRNSTITGNSAGEAGGGIFVCFVCGATEPELIKTVVSGNTPDNIAP